MKERGYLPGTVESWLERGEHREQSRRGPENCGNERPNFTTADGPFYFTKHTLYLYKADFENFSAILGEMTKYIIDEKGSEVISEIHDKDFKAKKAEAEEKANSTRYIEKAEGMKQVDVISAASKAEQDKYETMAAKLRYEIDAAGKEALNMAENVRSDASRRSALRNKLADKIESIIRESVKPMANIRDIKIVDVSGLPGFSGTAGGGSAGGGKDVSGGKSSGNLADNVVSSALRYRAHQPFLDSLLKEIGMNPGEVSNIRNILGDYGNPKKDYHMNFGENVNADLKGDKSPKK